MVRLVMAMGVGLMLGACGEVPLPAAAGHGAEGWRGGGVVRVSAPLAPRPEEVVGEERPREILDGWS